MIDMPPQPPMQRAVASWYYDAGPTASGRHYHDGFAALIFGNQWGKRVLFCHARRCQVGRLDDHGPYVAGRTFDLNPNLRASLHCPGLCAVRWRVAPRARTRTRGRATYKSPNYKSTIVEKEIVDPYVARAHSSRAHASTMSYARAYIEIFGISFLSTFVFFLS
jgi:hypothetical protein